MLELKNVWIKYGKNVAVRKLTLTVNKGDFVTILGANGAGKSSTLNAISGLLKAKDLRGEIDFKGQKINGLKPGAIAARGIIQIPEGRKLFPLMTVRENLEMGAYLCRDRRVIANSMEKVMSLFPVLKEKLPCKARRSLAADSSKWWPSHVGLWLHRSSSCWMNLHLALAHCCASSLRRRSKRSTVKATRSYSSNKTPGWA